MSEDLKVDGGPMPAGLPLPGVPLVAVDSLLIAAQAGQVGMVAARTAAVGAELAQLASHPALIATAALDAPGAARVLAAISDAGLGRNGVAANVGRLTAHAGRVGASAAAYEVTEGRTAYVVNVGIASVDDLATRLMGIPIPEVQRMAASWLLTRRVVSELNDVVHDMAAGKPINEVLLGNGEDLARESLEIVISALPALTGPPYTAERAARAFTSGLHTLKRDGSDKVLEVVAHPPAKSKGEPGFQGVIKELREVNKDGKEATVSMSTITHPDGSKVHILSLPGTQGGFGGSNPMDWASNFQEKSGKGSDARKVALAALASIPKGSRVMITGYSQGGLVATNLAADPAIRRRFRIDNILTCGSPVGDVTRKLPSSITTMNVEFSDDSVPAADGRRVVPGPNRYVARADSPDNRTPGLIGPHKFMAYSDGLDKLDRSDDPKAREYLKSTKDYQLQEGSKVEVQEFTGRRVP